MFLWNWYIVTTGHWILMDDVLVLFYFHCYAPHPVRRSVDTRMDPSISGGTLSTTPFVSLPSGRRFGSRATISTLILLSETWRFWWLAPVVQETVGVEVRGREAPKCVWCDKFELCTTFLCLQRCLGTRGVTPRPAGSVGWCWGPGGTPGTNGGRNIARWGVWLCSEQILGS